MRLGDSHLTYCTNIHPGESWDEIRDNLSRHVPRVKQGACPQQAFGLGLRLSNVAARSLAEPAALAEFDGFLRDQGLYVFTLNGFPYGPFHGTRVKQAVYLPDWRDEARLEYTNLLADLLARWLEPGYAGRGSISTVPGAIKANAAAPEAVARMADLMIRHVAHLVRIERETGRVIVLALEPEPCCFLETVEETVAFFRDYLYSPLATARLAALAGLNSSAARQALSRHAGVCLDLCHASVEFEDAAGCLRQLDDAGIQIAKIQVTAGLRIPRVTPSAIEALQRYDDAVYLHQVVERRGRVLTRYVDLDEACASAAWRAGGCEWRVHFHVPVFLERLDGFFSTQPFVREVLALHRQRARAPHLEVETYTWSVLPAGYRDVPVEDAIARELCWVREVLA